MFLRIAKMTLPEQEHLVLEIKLMMKLPRHHGLKKKKQNKTLKAPVHTVGSETTLWSKPSRQGHWTTPPRFPTDPLSHTSGLFPLFPQGHQPHLP